MTGFGYMPKHQVNPHDHYFLCGIMHLPIGNGTANGRRLVGFTLLFWLLAKKEIKYPINLTYTVSLNLEDGIQILS